MATIARWNRHVNVQLLDDPVIAETVSTHAVERHCRAAGHRWRDSFWSPGTTVVTFLLQVLDGAKTLRAAVALLLAQLAARGHEALPADEPSAYCQARKRLPLEVVTQLGAEISVRIRGLVTGETGWCGRQVWLVDGSSVSMPDTPALQAVFPQPPGQAKGCGFPVAQVVALFCWTTGAIRDVAIDALTPHELPLFRRLWHHFASGDVVVADRAYGSYVDMVRLRDRGTDSVFRLHQRRKADFRTGKSLGQDDRLVVWTRPAQWLDSFGISREAFEGLPETMPVRLVRVTNAPRGFRSRTIVVATTLLDPIAFPGDAIRALYRDRWTAELNLRSIKSALGMEILRGLSPDVVRKEIAMHLLAYNLIRLLMWHAACQHGRDLHRLSFTGTLHRLRAILPLLMNARTPQANASLLAHFCGSVAADAVPHRPDRFEPRRVKRRPKPYSRLMKPRTHYHKHGDPDAR